MVIITGSAIQFSATNQQTAVYPAVGTILLWGGNDSNNLNGTDYLICNGSLISKTTYDVLFGIIGYRYGGSGDNFNLPDLRERIPLGANSSANVQYNSTYTGGTNKLDNNRYYPHTHPEIQVKYFVGPPKPPPLPVLRDPDGGDGREGMEDYSVTNTDSGFISNIGDGNPASSDIYYPQYTLVNYIIKAKTTPYTS